MAQAAPLEVVLLREELEITKRVVPYERVRVHTDLVTEQQAVQATLRSERIDIDHTSHPQQGRTS